MEVSPQAQLTFLGVDVFHVSFASQKPYLLNTPVDLQIIPKVFYPEDRPNDFNIVIEAKLTCAEYYDITIGVMGRFSINQELAPDLRKVFINSNAPAILFPYVRSFISTFSSNLGGSVNPIIIPPQFFKGDLEEVKLPLEPNAQS
jgi:preprotein translocase subunit SecB